MEARKIDTKIITEVISEAFENISQCIIGDNVKAITTEEYIASLENLRANIYLELLNRSSEIK